MRNSVAAAPPIKASAASAEEAEDARYEVVKDVAKHDHAVMELKAKADRTNTNSPEAQRQAMIEYNHALFRKMKVIDASLAERVDLVEAAILKRINE